MGFSVLRENAARSRKNGAELSSQFQKTSGSPLRNSTALRGRSTDHEKANRLHLRQRRQLVFTLARRRKRGARAASPRGQVLQRGNGHCAGAGSQLIPVKSKKAPGRRSVLA